MKKLLSISITFVWLMVLTNKILAEDLLVKADGTVAIAGKTYNCQLGKNGVSEDKKEGDGTTPVGSFAIREVYYRADRIPEKLITQLPVYKLRSDSAWVDDVNSLQYNQYVTLPFKDRHEKLWLEDHTYDVIVVLGYNDAPAVKGKGSAIFMHISHADKSLTQGCIACEKSDLLEILQHLDNQSKVVIQDINH